jgi:hypothetical protein
VNINLFFPDNLFKKHIDIYYLISDLSLKYKFKNEIIDDNYLKVIGKKLWNLIEKYNSLRSIDLNKTIDFVLVSENQDIQKIPWEISFNENFGFIGLNKNFSFSRTFWSSLNMKNMNNEFSSMNILHVSYDNSDLLLQKEKLFFLTTIIQKHHISFTNIKNIKQDLDKYNPNILIISGHMEYNYEPHRGMDITTKPKHDFILNKKNIPIWTINDIIKDYDLKLIILLGCESTKNITSSLFDNNAYHLLKNNIHYVIGMREPILDIASIEFIKSLFTLLIDGKNIHEAIQLSRKSIILPMKNIYNDIRKNISYGQWCIPELYFR